ncbi:MFS transporter [Streptomyces sp. H10-C2]|uniref:MFS transporter n=1 Tax=unclassified Streptomyces TaxID=2593676 RepID=UPI0024B8AF5F|nr:MULTISPECIES: MFS transporter [unclassified Streptomyces]MDJ0344359.1 MFS transporter [Streptomyces sp. PH10-H1]MDJ0373728.1 MFS transporter [Streptomyces sp. H10-C2]
MHRPAPLLLLMVNGGTLIAADRTVNHPVGARPSRGPSRGPSGEPSRKASEPSRLGAYRRIFAAPGTTAFTVGSLLSRAPMGMFGVSLIIMVATTRGSYALAGAVAAAGMAATAVLAPVVARLTDQYGQARIAVPATVWSVAACLALLLCVRYDAPSWTLFATYIAKSTTPNTGGMARARWARLYRDDPAARHVANSFEQVADELCFLLGPVLAAFLCTALFPEAGMLVANVLLLAGVLLFAAQRGTEPPAPGRAGAGTRSPVRIPGMPALLAVFFCTGVVFGAMEITTIAYADSQGHTSAAGAVLALQAAGSGVAGLLYGLSRPAGPATARFAGAVAAMAALMTLPLLARNLPELACCLFLAGCATAPTMVNGMTLVQSLVPAARLNEGMTLAVTGILAGISAGAALAGAAAERFAPSTGFWLPAAAGALALLLAAGMKKAPPR